MAVELDDDVAGDDARILGRPVLHDVCDQGAVGIAQTERLGDVRGYLLDQHAEPAAGDLTLLLELGEQLGGEVDRDSEADADAAAAAAEDGGVDADDLALEVDERTARVAGVDGDVGLDELVVARLTDEAALGADDTGG